MRYGKYIGDRSFYRQILLVAIPIIAQNAITNIVSLLDNVMVGQLSTAELSGVTIVNNNLINIFHLCVFGGTGGAGIFTAQFHGCGDNEGIRHTFRFKLWICFGLLAIALCVFSLFPNPLIGLYLRGDGDPQLAISTLRAARQYLFMMLPGLLPHALVLAYSGTLRECGHPMVSMIASLVATVLNLCLNFFLIFGHFGFPAMGVRGAALATVIARYTEFGIIAVWTHCHTAQLPFVKGLLRFKPLPKALLCSIIRVDIPLLINDALFAFGQAFLNQCYSTCGLDAMAALSISSTIYNLSSVVFRSLGICTGVFMGQKMGAETPEKPLRDHFAKLAALTICSGIFFGLLMALMAPIFPGLYNTTPKVREMASGLILLTAATMPLLSFFYPIFYTVRAGGKTGFAGLLDSGDLWLLHLPLAFILSRFTNADLLLIFGVVGASNIIKCIVSWFMIRSRIWIQNLSVIVKTSG